VVATKAEAANAFEAAAAGGVAVAEGEEPRRLSSPTPQPSAAAAPRRAPMGALRAGRNDPCPCGSGKKYKKCHLASDEGSA
jgi:uncharacterized protein YecA (UPF0149 family)